MVSFALTMRAALQMSLAKWENLKPASGVVKQQYGDMCDKSQVPQVAPSAGCIAVQLIMN